MPTPKAAAATFSTALIRELAQILNETGLTEIEVERGGQKIRVAKTVTAAFTQAFAQPLPDIHAAPLPDVYAAAPEPARSGDTVNSPMVGTVYLQPQPGAPAFIKVGETVAAGQTLLLIEAMKTMNPIAAPRAGTVLEVLVVDSQPVEFGEPLVVIG